MRCSRSFRKIMVSKSLPEDKRFERFASYLVVSPHLADSFDTADIATGSGGDTGIDAIAIVVNGTLVTDQELVKELAETNGYLDVTFVFVQAERSSSFEGSKIGTFGYGVMDFFKEIPTLPRNEEVKEARRYNECDLCALLEVHTWKSCLQTLLCNNR